MTGSCVSGIPDMRCDPSADKSHTSLVGGSAPPYSRTMRRLLGTITVAVLLVAGPVAQAAVLWRPPPPSRCAGSDGKAKVIAEAKWSGSGWKGPYRFVQTRTKAATTSSPRAATSVATSSWSEEGWTWKTGTITTKVKKGKRVIKKWETRLKPC